MELKEKLVIIKENYLQKYNELKDSGFTQLVEWEIIRKMLVYLHNKNMKATSGIIEYMGFYSAVVLGNWVYEGEVKKQLSAIVITPEDTEGTAYGKVDRIIISKYKEYLKEQEEKTNE